MRNLALADTGLAEDQNTSALNIQVTVQTRESDSLINSSVANTANIGAARGK